MKGAVSQQRVVVRAQKPEIAGRRWALVGRNQPGNEQSGGYGDENRLRHDAGDLARRPAAEIRAGGYWHCAPGAETIIDHGELLDWAELIPNNAKAARRKYSISNFGRGHKEFVRRRRLAAEPMLRPAPTRPTASIVARRPGRRRSVPLAAQSRVLGPILTSSLCPGAQSRIDRLRARSARTGRQIGGAMSWPTLSI